MRNYDETQRTAILVRCLRCQLFFYMTQLHILCLACRGRR